MVRVATARKLFLAAGGFYGPNSGLGVLGSGPLGEMRSVMSHRILVPAEMPEPFLWELHLAANEDLPALRLSLAGGPELQVRLYAGRRSEVTGVAASAPGRVRALEFQLDEATPVGTVQYLGLSLLSLQDSLAPAGPIE